MSHMIATVLQTIPQTSDYIRILPEIVLAVFGMAVMVLDPLVDDEHSRRTLGLIALVGTISALVATWYMAQSPGLAFSGMVRADSFSVFFHALVIAISGVVVLMSFEYTSVQKMRGGEYYGLILFSAVGMGLMSSAVELVLIFIALEISSISSYVLAGMRRHEAASGESALKYFLLGSFATAFFLYGIALLYGATGSTNIEAIALRLPHTFQDSQAITLVYVAAALMFVGLGFKLAAAPFHVWTPDVYEGAPAPVVGFMSTAPKAAAFAVLLRVVFQLSMPRHFWIIWVAAVLSMTLGNLGALLQDNVKRLLAYSSIAHAGYVLVAFASVPDLGAPAVIFYTAAYAAMNVGAFAIVSHLGNIDEKYVSLRDYEGLGQSSPVLAASLTIFLLSLIGIPMTGGFFGKFYVFSAAFKSNLIWLSIIGVINSAIGAYYYLRIIVAMYMRQPEKATPVARVPFGVGLATAVCLAATFYLGLFPGRVLDLARLASEAVSNSGNAAPVAASSVDSGIHEDGH